MKFASVCEKHQISLHVHGEFFVTALLILQMNDVKLLCFLRVQENAYLRQQLPNRQDWLVVHKNSASQNLINPYKRSSQQLI
jgi:hypothetical protein